MRPTIPVMTQSWKEPPLIDLPSELNSLHLPELVARVLYRQGIRTATQARAYMDFHSYTPTSAYDIPDMEKSIKRTTRAIKDNERIGVWGDFDVDGQTATAILVAALRKVGANVVYHIPIRGPESHGIQLEVLKKFVQQGLSLIISCDTGISEIESIAWAQHKGVDVIITDHHTLPEKLPQAYAVVNPQRLEVNHSLRPLPGAGVAYKFAEALLGLHNQAEYTHSLHDLASLGIIADIAELRGDCRFLVQSGIELIRTSPRASIQAILQAAEINADQFTEESISYSIAPRLNAVGRLADANSMVEFLLTEDPALISVTVNQLEGLNVHRKLLCDQVFLGALDQIERTPSLLDHPVLMLAHPEWPAGVVGIVASRLVSIYHKPVILFVSPPNELMRGSVRSLEGIDITAAIRQHSFLLSSFGGHPMAAGLSLDPLNFRQFQRALDRTLEYELMVHPLVNELQIDSWQEPSAIDLETLQSIDQLAPFGVGNPPLEFANKGMRLTSATAIGKTHEHLQMIVEDAQGQTNKLIWWQGAGLPRPEGTFDLAYSARSSTYKGQHQVQLEWLGFRYSESEKSTITSKNNGSFESIDNRSCTNRLHLLKEINAQFHPEVYREGLDIISTPGKLRYELLSCPSLVVWSIPPSQAVLDEIITKVNPERIFWFGVEPSETESEIILKTAIQIIKQGFLKNQPAFEINKMAAKLGATGEIIHLIVQWLAARGDIEILLSNEELVELKSHGISDHTQQNESKRELKRALAESIAYKRFYLRVDIASLTNHS